MQHYVNHLLDVCLPFGVKQVLLLEQLPATAGANIDVLRAYSV